MEANCKMYQRLRIGCVVMMVVCLSICNVGIYETMAQSVEIQSPTTIVAEDKKIPPTEVESEEDTEDTSTADAAWVAPSPKTETTDSSNTMLYLGAGAVAAAALAIGLASSGGGSGGGGVDSIAPPVTPSEPPVGADIAGSDWSGILLLINGQREPITAVVTQNGSQVQITTSSTQSYGQSFSGTIRQSGHMLMYDQTTGEDWTTHVGPATSTHIELNDYVNNFTALDVLVLKR